MISKLAKAHESFLFKIISALVAISFISLFGVSGYLTSAGQNQTVVDVDGLTTTQSEFSYRLQKELNAIKNLAGDDFEISEEMRNSVSEAVLEQIVSDGVLDKTMEKYGIYFPKAFIQQVIFSQPEFKNPANGQFNPDIFKRYLSAAGLSEGEYVAMVKRMMARKMLVGDLIEGFGVPEVLSNAIHKMDNQRKTFKYVEVSPSDVKIERKISDDEIRQYYEDFSENFMIPETREALVLFIPNEVILNKFAASPEMIEDYFAQNKKNFDQPEKREVLQMIFTDKGVAEKALEEVKGGKDFNIVAKELHAENADEPTLGVVAEDELAEGLSYDAFQMQKGESKLLEVADSWQVISIKEIISAKEADFESAKGKIEEVLKNENIYAAMREARALLDDTANSGKSLADAGKLFGIAPATVSGIREESPVEGAAAEVKPLTSTLDFNEAVFSYGVGETSSAEEFDEGIAVIEVTNIVDAHLPELDEIRDEIAALWTVQEKNALAKETAENIVTDAEDGTPLADAAKARELEVYRSEPISRNENFAGLSQAEISELFLAETGSVKSFERPNNRFVIVTPAETVNYKDELTEEAKISVQDRARSLMFTDWSQAAIDNYAKDFKVKIDYKRAGFAE